MGDTTLISRKTELRRQLRSLRIAIPEAARRQAALAAAHKALRLLRSRRHVAIYFPHGSELDTGPLMDGLLRRGHRLYVPRLRGTQMNFVALNPRAVLRRNRFGIAEPAGSRRAARLDAIVVPLVGFDRAGRRLGQGGGYYDRVLMRCRALRVGYAFSVQQAAVIPAGPLDARLDAVITENALWRFTRP